MRHQFSLEKWPRATRALVGRFRAPESESVDGDDGRAGHFQGLPSALSHVLVGAEEALVGMRTHP